MTSRRAPHVLFSLLLLPLLTTCTAKKKESAPSVAPTAGLPAHLEPTPEPPFIKIVPGPGRSADLEVVVARPQDDTEGDFHPTLTFSQPIVALSMISEQHKLPPPAVIAPPLEGEWRWIGSSSVEFVPKRAMPLATPFKVTVPAGLMALDGSKLKKDYSWEFRTPRPQLQRVAPTQSYPWLPATPTFHLVFNQAVNDLAAHVRVRAAGKDIAVTLVKEETVEQKKHHLRLDRRFTRDETDDVPELPSTREDLKDRRVRYLLTPRSALPLDREITLHIDARLSGKEGPLTLEKDLVLKYRTYGPPKLTEVRACSQWAGVNCAYGPLLVKVSNPMELKTLKPLLAITPKVEIDWEHAEMSEFPPVDEEFDFEEQTDADDPMRQWKPHFSLPGKYRPGTTYTLKIARGFQDVFGQSAAAFSGSSGLSNVEPYLEVEQKALLEASGDGAVPLESANVDKLQAQVWLLSPEELVRIEQNRHDSNGKLNYPEREPDKTLTVNLSGTRNRTRFSPLPLRSALPEGQRTGLFVARLSSPELPKDSSQRRVLAQLTDLAVHAKLGQKSSLCWVTSLSSGRPVAGATVAAYDAAGKKKWSGTTAPDGTVRLPAEPELFGYGRTRWEAPFGLISASKNGDTGVTLTDWEASDHFASRRWADNPPVGDGESLGVIFTDRGIYRPGDEVFIKGVLRYMDVGELSNLKPQAAIQLEIVGPDEKTLSKQTVRASAFSTFTTKLRVPKDATLGRYEIKATVQSLLKELEYTASFRVAEYRAPQFRVDVSAKPSLIAGDQLSANVISRYLFGGAMAGVKLRYTVSRRSDGDFAPPGPDNARFQFGQRTWGWNDDEPQSSSDVATAGEARADVQGSHTIVVPKVEAPAARTWNYTVEAEAEDLSRQRIAARAQITVHPAALYAGLRVAGEGFPESGKPVRVELVAVTPEGRPQLNAPIALEVKHRQWKFIRKKTIGNEWFTQNEPDDQKVAGCEARSAAPATPASCTFTPAAPGSYLLSASVRDDRGRTQTTTVGIYVSGTGWVSWQRSDTQRLELIADRSEYAVGDTARILIKNPYPGAQALVTVEREGVSTARVVALDSSAVTVPIPITEAAVPNTYVTAVLVRGRVQAQNAPREQDAGAPALLSGGLELKVTARTRQLHVDVKADSEHKRPGDKVRVALQVKDFRDKPPGVPVELTLWAVDEGVLRLTSYELPDLLTALYAPRSHGVRHSESIMHLVLRRLYGEKGATPGGSGGLDPVGGELRRTFRTTALFLPSLITDAAGRAQAEFTLPDNLTTFRIMAVAVAGKDRFGAGQSKVVVSKPLLVLSTLPRLARVGDKFEAGVVVHRGPEAQGALTVNVAAQATGLKLTSAAEQRVEIAAGKPREVRFQFIAEQPGTAVLKFQVEGGGERDALEEKLRVQLSVEREAVATYGDTRDRRVEGILPPRGVRPDYGGLEVTLSSTAMAGFSENFRQLVDYPYGCLEQLSSRLVPFVALRDLQKTFAVTATNAVERAKERQRIQEIFFGLGMASSAASAKSSPEQVAAETISQIEKLQTSEGGFRYWSSARCATDWGSAYAVLALGQAQKGGYTVDQQVLSRGQRFLSDVVAAGKPIPCELSFHRFPPDDATRIFALYALARSGEPRPSYYSELFGRRQKLPLFARAMLVDTMVRGGGDREQARQLLREILNFAKESPQGAYFQETDAESYAPTWTSDTRTTALVLQALLSAQPEHPFVSKISRYLTLVRKQDGRYRTTQEAAFSLMALADLVRTKEKETPNFTASVLLGKEQIGSAQFVGRSLNVQRLELPITRFAEGPRLPLEFSKQGAGIVYYSAMLRYAMAEPPTKPLEQGIVVQRWFEPYSGGGQSTKYSTGDLVRVRVRIGTSMERRFVAVDVPLPAGLEPVDTTLATTARLPAKKKSEDGDEEPSDKAGALLDSADQLTREEFFAQLLGVFVSPFNHVEQRDDRVVLFADRLPPGVHAESFVARATTPGDFIARPAHAEEMYTPEVFGRSDGGRLVVTAPGVETKK